MNRIERIGSATLYLGDCREVLQTLGAFDAVITDPPYGINANTRTKKSARVGASASRHAGDPVLQDWPNVVGDNMPFDPAVWVTLGRCVLFGANHFSDRLPASGKWLIWDKRRGNTSDDNADCEIAWSNAKGPARVFSHLWRGMIRDSETGQKRVHPTQKPIALMEWVLRHTTKEGETVLDPYMGSGTTGIAALRTARKFIGVEIEKQYFDTACRRIEAETRQCKLAV